MGVSALPTVDMGVGTRGEYCAHVLAVLGLTDKVSPGRRHPGGQEDANASSAETVRAVPYPLRAAESRDDANAFLKYQVEAWLSDIVRPTEIDSVWFPSTSMTALRPFHLRGRVGTCAEHTGFGVSYSLPIVLAALLARGGGLLLIENPEAHLHPAGQSRMGTFLAAVAADGVQVVVETHSDHVLNGIRRAIGEQHVLSADSAPSSTSSTANADGEPVVSLLQFHAGQEG